MKMNNLFTTYEQSLKLRDLGFDEPCIQYYDNDNRENTFKLFPYFSTIGIRNSERVLNQGFEQTVSAPLYKQAFDFLREKYNIYHVPKPVLGSKNGYDSFPIIGWDFDVFISHKDYNSHYMGYPIGEWFTATLDNFDPGETLEDLNIHPIKFEQIDNISLDRMIKIINKDKKK